jgi:L-ascorbate 6-phosphate lactonase
MTGGMDEILKTEIGREELGIWWLGQAGYIFKSYGDRLILVDPYLSDSVGKTIPGASRLYPLPILPGEITCDAVLCTHDHMDHLDSETIESLKNKDTVKFIGPESCCSHYTKLGISQDNIIQVNCGQQIEIYGIKIRAVFTIPLDEETIDGIGYLITFPDGITVYHSGDTSYCDFLPYIKKYGIDIALLCINGKYKNMNYGEAALLSSQVGAKLAIPNHYDMLAGNMEDPRRFTDRVEKINSSIKCEILQVMRLLKYKKCSKKEKF